jgi:hypothetical protein
MQKILNTDTDTQNMLANQQTISPTIYMSPFMDTGKGRF